MAKQVKPGSIMFRVWCGGGEDPRVDAMSYDLNDGSNPDITSYNKSGTEPAAPATNHTLTAGELGDGSAGTLAKLLTDIENAIKTAESIS